MSTSSQNPLLAAIDALKAGDRSGAVGLLKQDFALSAANGERWKSVHRLCSEIGEIDMALEAARRFAATQPDSISFQLFYWGELVNHGRVEEASALSNGFPTTKQSQIGMAHFQGTVATLKGQFDYAEAHFRTVVELAPNAAQSWLALAMIKTFGQDDSDLMRMQAVSRGLSGKNIEAEAPLHYAIAKAFVDIGEYEFAMQAYERGSALKRQQMPYDRAQQEAAVGHIIRDFTAANMHLLTPTENGPCRALFVTGLPRSGSTLVEQILATHSAVNDGGEINLLRAAITSNGAANWNKALAFQAAGQDGGDPWAKVATDYHHMLNMRFGSQGLVVDKTLMQSRVMGHLLHALPNARVIWMRRNPKDVALSCYRAYFTASLPWSWNFGDIAHFIALEDRLFAHWQSVGGDRILAVPYEELVASPEIWVRKIANHVGLTFEEAMLSSHQSKRAVRTASLLQVRQPINAKAVGKSLPFLKYMTPYF